MRPNLIDFAVHGDDQGYLVALEENRDIPFTIRRVYYIFDTGTGARRGFHAHRRTRQLAVCVCGSCKFLLDDGRSTTEVRLDSKYRGLVIDPMIWHLLAAWAKVLGVSRNGLITEIDGRRSQAGAAGGLSSAIRTAVLAAVRAGTIGSNPRADS